MFAVAFVAMRTVRSARLDDARLNREPTPIVRLIPPVAETKVVSRPRPFLPRPVDLATPARPASPPDTLSIRAAKPVSPTGPPLTQMPARDIPTFQPGAGDSARRVGAPMSPSGVTGYSNATSTAVRDSIATEKMTTVPSEMLKHRETPDERQKLNRQREPGLAPHARAARMPGEPVYAPLMSGGYTVGYGALAPRLDSRGLSPPRLARNSRSSPVMN